MTVLLARAHVTALRFRGSLRQYWKRIVLGAFCGWVASSVLGAFALVWLEVQAQISSDTSALLGAAIVWSGTALGGLVAYAARPSPAATA